MHVLIAAATPLEIQPTIALLAKDRFAIDNHQLEVIITGVGAIATTYSLSSAINKRRPGFIIQAGIAGSFSSNLMPGTVVIIKEEIIADMGAEEKNDFKDIFDLGLAGDSTFPFANKLLTNKNTTGGMTYDLPHVRGITINEITTRSHRVELLQKKYAAETESMEGAALHYVCLRENIPFLQVRSISNYVGERDKRNWKMKEAIENLNKELITIIRQMPAGN